MDYYSYDPSYVLTKNVILTGAAGTGIDVVASILSQRTGLTLKEPERWLEHSLGASVGELLILKAGEVRTTMVGFLPQLLDGGARGIIVGTDLFLEMLPHRFVLRGKAHVVHLGIPLATLFARLQGQPDAAVRVYPFTVAAPASLDEMAKVLARLPRRTRWAHDVLDVGGASVTKVAEVVLAMLVSKGLARPSVAVDDAETPDAR